MKLSDISKRPLDWEDVLLFGKHKGQTIKQVYDNDPQWLLWAYESTDMSLRPDVIKKVIVIEPDDRFLDPRDSYLGWEDIF